VGVRDKDHRLQGLSSLPLYCVFKGTTIPVFLVSGRIKTFLMKKILLPVDGSQLGDFAYQMAKKIAEKTKASITVLSIVPAPADAFFDADGRIKDDEGEDLSSFIKAKESLEIQIQNWVADKPFIHDAIVKIGRVNKDIVHLANTGGFDMVVMGTSGAHGLDEWLRNSHTAKVVRDSIVPVLSLKCDRSELKIKDILLVGDFEGDENLELQAVKKICKAFDAKIHLLKINTARHFQSQRQIMPKMEAFAQRHDLSNFEIHIYNDESVEKGIMHFSEDSGIDFVVMGHHQQKGLSRLFRHDISEDVVNHLWQPIMTFPA
jgi:nucleotide-binding universal stress UspA family protein